MAVRNPEQLRRERQHFLEDYRSLCSTKYTVVLQSRGEKRRVERPLPHEEVIRILSEWYYKTPSTVEQLIRKLTNDNG
jgi:hypothetical protein